MTTERDMLPHLANRPLALLPSFALSPRPRERDTTPGLAASVAIIPVCGVLTNEPYSWWGQSYADIRYAFMAALAADDVAAIALLVDSPGGTVAGCFDLVDTIYAARGTKPVHAILAEDAFSAAFAITSATDYIHVPRTGGTGSVGVIKLHLDQSGMMGKIGLVPTLLTYGARKADGNPFEPLSDEAREREMADIKEAGELFVETVARNLDLKASVVRATEAATYTGAASVEIGFAHSVAAPDAAFAALLSTL